MMKRAMITVLGLCVLCTTAYGDEEKGDELTDPIAILKKADAASKAVKAVKYKVTLKGTEGAALTMPEVEGTVIMTGWSQRTNRTPQKFRCEAKVKQPGSSEVVEITVGSDGKTFYAVDHKAMKAYADGNPAVMGRKTGPPAQNLMMLEFVYPTPFSDEIGGKDQKLKGSKKIGDEDCYEIYLNYGRVSQEAIWYFSKKDFLPRGVRRVRPYPPAGKKGGEEWMLTDLVVDPTFDEEKDPFKFDLPEGYTKMDTYAP
ncbi:MAG: hypothetical protein WBE26_06210 [Phycisphaerae bacterium]